MFCSRDIQIFVFLWNLQISKFVTSSLVASYTYAYLFWILSPIKIKFGQILVCCMIKISNMFLDECWRLETSSRLFYDFILLLHLLISINWPSLVTSWFVVQKIYSKMHLISCTNTDTERERERERETKILTEKKRLFLTKVLVILFLLILLFCWYQFNVKIPEVHLEILGI